MGRLAGRPPAGRWPHDLDPARRNRRRRAAHRPGAVRVHRRSGRPDHAAVERLGLHPEPPHGLTRFLEGPADTAPLPRRRARRDCAGRVAVRAPRDRHGPRFPRHRAGDYRVRHPHPYAGRVRARLDLRARLRRPRSARSGLGLRGGARPREFPEVRGIRQREPRQSGGRRRADGEGLCLRPLADGALHPRCNLPRLQRRCGRAQGVRRRVGARRRLRAHVDEPPLRQRRRAGGSAI